jgi:hypothetical protein
VARTTLAGVARITLAIIGQLAVVKGCVFTHMCTRAHTHTYIHLHTQTRTGTEAGVVCTVPATIGQLAVVRGCLFQCSCAHTHIHTHKHAQAQKQVWLAPYWPPLGSWRSSEDACSNAPVLTHTYTQTCTQTHTSTANAPVLTHTYTQTYTQTHRHRSRGGSYRTGHHWAVGGRQRLLVPLLLCSHKHTHTHTHTLIHAQAQKQVWLAPYWPPLGSWRL